jgi:muramoyltetrapeptide carboxypeptidase LdcA involved in peptidoglycan recycling
MRFPAPLRPGDTIGVTAPSSGVPDPLRPRIEAGIASLRARGYDVKVGECLYGGGVTSAPKEHRAAELTAMLQDPAIRAVAPPWGGELATDLLDLVDWEALREADPTWLVGFSDLTSVMLPLTLITGWATLHGSNLMDTAFRPAPGSLHWTEVAATTAPFTQSSPGHYREGWDDYENDPGVTEMTLDLDGTWSLLDGGSAEFGGRLIGGCIESVSPLAATPYADVPGFGRRHADDGIMVFLEACEQDAYTIGRALHAFRHAGWFEHATGILIGRTEAPDRPDLTQREAVLDALGPLGLPVVLDFECGHVQPFLPLVLGATAHVVVDDERREISQTFA